MNKTFINIKKLGGIGNPINPLRGAELSKFNSIENAYLKIHSGKIESFGSMKDFVKNEGSDLVDCTGKIILPTYCDSHTHFVFAATREGEFVDRIKGLSYQEIAAKGGGILNSARKLGDKTEDELFEDAKQRLIKAIRYGTGAVEIKSGYGLSVESEIKMLRVIKRLKQEFEIPIKATFLGAHAIPAEYKENREGYLDLIINDMLPVIKNEQLADYIDVFCEQNYFTIEEMERVCKAGIEIGLKPKVHVNQFNAFGAVKSAIGMNAVSVDHLEEMNEEDFSALQKSKTIATALPSCSFFLSIPYAPLKEMLNQDIAVALASDYNPGSTPNFNMNMVVALACIKQRLLPEEALNAATINGAFAMEIDQNYGSISQGKAANFMVTQEITDYSYIPYSFGENVVEEVYINGKKF